MHNRSFSTSSTMYVYLYGLYITAALTACKERAEREPVLVPVPPAPMSFSWCQRPDPAPWCQPPAVDANLPSRPIEAVLRGVPMKIVTALATEGRGGKVELTFSGKRRTCKDIWDVPALDEPWFQIAIAPYLYANGELRAAIAQTRIRRGESMTSMTRGRPPIAAVDLREGARSKLTLDIAESTSVDSPDGVTRDVLRAYGDVEVVGCGVYPRSPRERPSQGTLTIAGRKMAIFGAVLSERSGTSKLQVSDGEMACIPAVVTDGGFKVGVEWDSGVPRGDFLEGDWVDSHGHIFQIDSNAERLIATRIPGGDPSAPRFTLHGSTTFDGYAVAWTGTVTAIVCKD